MTNHPVHLIMQQDFHKQIDLTFYPTQWSEVCVRATYLHVIVPFIPLDMQHNRYQKQAGQEALNRSPEFCLKLTGLFA